MILDQGCKKTKSGGTDLLPVLTGKWSGTWTDTKFNMTGTISVVFTVNGSNITAAGTIGLSAFGLGSIPWTGTGNADETTITFSFSGANFVNGTGVVTGRDASGSGSIAGLLNFGAFTFTGTVGDSKISGNFDFTNPAGGEGEITLDKD